MDNQKQEKSIPLIAFFVLEVLFIIIIISIIAINTGNDKIESADSDRQPSFSIKDTKNQLPGAPTSYIKTIEQLLAKTIELNSENFDTRGSSAEIRDGSLTTVQFDQVDSVYYSMIVDIPDLQQSYQIYALYPLNAESPNQVTYSTRFVLCLDKYSEEIYPEFNCKDLFQPNTRQTIVSNMINYFIFDGFVTRMSNKVQGQINIISTTKHMTEQEREKNINQVKEKVKSLGVSPEIFTYYFTPSEDEGYSL